MICSKILPHIYSWALALTPTTFCISSGKCMHLFRAHFKKLAPIKSGGGLPSKELLCYSFLLYFTILHFSFSSFYFLFYYYHCLSPFFFSCLVRFKWLLRSALIWLFFVFYDAYSGCRNCFIVQGLIACYINNLDYVK